MSLRYLRLALLIFIFAIASRGYAQNLIKNGSFENRVVYTTDIPNTNEVTQFNDFVKTDYWMYTETYGGKSGQYAFQWRAINPTNGTADLLRTTATFDKVTLPLFKDLRKKQFPFGRLSNSDTSANQNIAGFLSKNKYYKPSVDATKRILDERTASGASEGIYREYLYQDLGENKVLINHTYKFSAKVSKAMFYGAEAPINLEKQLVNINRIGVYFSKDRLNYFTSSTNGHLGVLTDNSGNYVEPQIKIDKVIDQHGESDNSDGHNWITIEGKYTNKTNQNFQHIYIGYFERDIDTENLIEKKHDDIDISNEYVLGAYTFIDDISLIEIATEVPCDCKVSPFELLPGQNTEYSNQPVYGDSQDCCPLDYRFQIKKCGFDKIKVYAIEGGVKTLIKEFSQAASGLNSVITITSCIKSKNLVDKYVFEGIQNGWNIRTECIWEFAPSGVAPECACNCTLIGDYIDIVEIPSTNTNQKCYEIYLQNKSKTCEFSTKDISMEFLGTQNLTNVSVQGNTPWFIDASDPFDNTHRSVSLNPPLSNFKLQKEDRVKIGIVCIPCTSNEYTIRFRSLTIIRNSNNELYQASTCPIDKIIKCPNPNCCNDLNQYLNSQDGANSIYLGQNYNDPNCKILTMNIPNQYTNCFKALKIEHYDCENSYDPITGQPIITQGYVVKYINPNFTGTSSYQPQEFCCNECLLFPLAPVNRVRITFTDEFGNECVIIKDGFCTPFLKKSNGESGDNYDGTSLDNQILDYSVQPNPSSDRTSLRFNLSDRADTRIEIFNSAGQSVMLLKSQIFAKGENLVDFDAKELQNGAYFIRISTTSGANVSIPLTIKR